MFFLLRMLAGQRLVLAGDSRFPANARAYTQRTAYERKPACHLTLSPLRVSRFYARLPVDFKSTEYVKESLKPLL